MVKNEIKGYRGNTTLRAPEDKLVYDKKQIKELAKCRKDPIYFLKNYVKIVSLDDGIVNFNLYDYQEEMINLIHENTRIIGRSSRQSGKCVVDKSDITIRDKETGDIKTLTIKEFYDMVNLD
ncbi:hypothetical protein [uncultured Arcobacter sp.]|uniref:hypothetical protein n=1 Tax=uncultured Arcobacter sp. TaxID=165434 RepID=UPI0026173A99|nr:hypothetical protein [uncultured Arcobacter sp.]